MSTEDLIEQREAEKLVHVHRSVIEGLQREIVSLQRRIGERKALLAKAELSAKGIKPCAICNRHVPSPCNSRGGMMEHGPWDGFCKEFMDNRNA